MPRFSLKVYSCCHPFHFWEKTEPAGPTWYRFIWKGVNCVRKEIISDGGHLEVLAAYCSTFFRQGVRSPRKGPWERRWRRKNVVHPYMCYYSRSESSHWERNVSFQSCYKGPPLLCSLFCLNPHSEFTDLYLVYSWKRASVVAEE